MRFVAPARASVDAGVFDRPPLSQWREFDALLRGPDWPGVAALNEFARSTSVSAGVPRFVEQTPVLLAEGLHYEQRIAERGEIATRDGNWHDLLNALIWMRHAALKAALNERQMAEIAIAGPKQRTRAQCALTLFDEAGVIVLVSDPTLLALWDAHDWHGLFWRERDAWRDGRTEVVIFGHALLEHALKPRQLCVGKALVVVPSAQGPVDVATSATREPGGAQTRAYSPAHAVQAITAAIRSRDLLNDPQELRPLPLSGIPGWHAENISETFYRDAPCFRPLRGGRHYPAAFVPRSGGS